MSPEFRPGKPYFLRHVSAAYVPGAGTHLVVFDDDESDGSWPSISTTSIDVGVAGLYAVHYSIGLGRSANVDQTLNLLVDGVVRAKNEFINPPNTAVHGGRWMQLDVGATIELQITAMPASPANIGTATTLDVVRVGPVRWT